MILKHKKMLVLVGILILMVISVAGCGGNTAPEQERGSNGGEKANQSPELKNYEIKLAHSSPAVNDRLETACLEFKNYVEEKSGGRIKVTTFPASQLGGEREQMEGVQVRTIDMAAITTGPFPGIFKDIMVFDLPYLFSSQKVAWEVLDGPVGQEILERLRAETGIRTLIWGENGFRNFTNDVRPIRKPEDVKGLKIRTMENPAHMAFVKALGGDPTPMSFSEVYTALAQGTIDGQENPLSIIMSMRFWEVQKYVTLDGHLYSPYLFIINDDLYNSMDEEAQKIMDDGAKVWQQVERDLNTKQGDEAVAVLKKEGMQVEELSIEEVQAFREATKTVYDDFGKENIDNELLDKVLAAVNEAEEKLK